MEVKISRIDRSLPLPAYQTQGAVAFDFYARETVVIEPGTIFRIPTNLIIEVPQGYVLYVKDRSSTAGKGLLATAGIIDQDYCGPKDEILFQVYNYTKEKVTIERGERVAQGLFMKIAQAQWQETEKIKEENRGGFGSSG